MPIRQLIYVSDKAIPENAFFDEIAAIVRTAEKRNVTLGVTGCLGWTDACFAQVIEGEPSSVSSVLAAIGSDPRHRNITIMMDREVRACSFPDWRMARVDLRVSPVPLPLGSEALRRAPPALILASLMQAAEAQRRSG